MANEAARLRHVSRIIAGERKVSAASRRALERLLADAAVALHSSGMDPSVLDDRAPGWRAALDEEVMPAIGNVFTRAWEAAARGVIDPEPYATRHLEAVWNRLVGVSDTAFDSIREALAEGRQAQESIPQLAARVDALLADGERWKNRATVIARTEVIAANNAGALGSAGATADVLGVDRGAVLKEWMSTSDTRTRPTHQTANSQVVAGLDATFSVGAASLTTPGDPSGPGGEVIQCRCTVLFHYPGDSDYDAKAAQAGILNPLPTTPPQTPGGVTYTNAAGTREDPVLATVPADTLRTVTKPTQHLPSVAETRALGLNPDTASDWDLFLTYIDDPGNVAHPRERIDYWRAKMRAGEDIPPIQVTRRGQIYDGHHRAAAAILEGLAIRLRREDGTFPDFIAKALTAAVHQEDPMNLTAAGDSEEQQTTVVIVALPAEDDPIRDIGDEDKHATLLFYGETATLPAGARDVLEAATAAVAAVTGAAEETVDGVERLGSDDPSALVVMLAGSALPDIRQALMDQDPAVEEMLSNHEQYPSYTPHSTLGYPAAGSEEEAAWTEQASALTAVSFDRLAVWWEGEQTDYPLEGSMSTTAAAGDPAPVINEAAAGDPAPVIQEDGGIGAPGPEDDDQFYGVVTVEDSQTGDGRVFMPNSNQWDDVPFPIPLGWQVQDAPGHDGSVVCGRIDTMVRFGNLIGITGTWDLDGAGWETRRLVDGQFLTGVSVDTDDVDVEVVDKDGNPIDPMMAMFGEAEDAILAIKDARPRSAAMCRVPAFVEAFIANGTPPPGWAGERPGAAVEAPPAPAEGETPAETPPPADEEPASEEAVTAALVAAAERAGNPAAALWARSDFDDPRLTEPTALTITEDGEVFGHLATWGTCHIGYDGVCVTPPHSAYSYRDFHTGTAPTDGGAVPTGVLTIDTGHAPLSYGARAAAAHYDNTGAQLAQIAVGEDAIGIWMHGRVLPWATEEMVQKAIAAGAVSGDWRERGGSMELQAALVVNVAGFPVPRVAVAASGHVQTALVAAGMVRAPQTPPPAAGPDHAQIVASVVAAIDRRDRARVAASRLDARAEQARARRAAAAAARLER